MWLTKRVGRLPYSKSKITRQIACNVVPLAFLWIVRREKNRREFEGVGDNFAHLRNSLLSLIAFSCTRNFPIRIDDWVSLVKIKESYFDIDSLLCCVPLLKLMGKEKEKL